MAAGGEPIYEAGETRLTVDHLLHLLHGIDDTSEAPSLYALIVEENRMIRGALKRALGKMLPLCKIEAVESREVLLEEVARIVNEGRSRIGLIVTKFDSAENVGDEIAGMQGGEKPVVVSQVASLEGDFKEIRKTEAGLVEAGTIDGIVSLPSTSDDLAVELGVAINRASRARGGEFDAEFDSRCMAALNDGREEERTRAGLDLLLADLGVPAPMDVSMERAVARVAADPKTPIKIDVTGENRTKEAVLKKYLDKYKGLINLWKSFVEKLSVYPEATVEVAEFSAEDDSRNVAVGANRLAGIFTSIEVAEFVELEGPSRLRVLIHDLNNILAWMPMLINELCQSDRLTPDERAGMTSISMEMLELLAETKAIRFANHRLEDMTRRGLPGDHEDLKGLPTWDMVSKGDYPSPTKQKLDIAAGTRVLVIDDDRMVAGFCKRIIEQAGGVCTLVCNERELVKALQEGLFDWIWLDNNLSVGGGFTTVRRGWELLSRMPAGTKVAVHTGDVESIRTAAEGNPYGDLPLVQKRDFNAMSQVMKSAQESA